MATDNGLSFEITVKNDGEEQLPYSIGWHPAFAVGSGKAYVEYQGSKHEINEVYSEHNNVRKLILVNRIVLETDSYNISITHNFGNLVLWNPYPKSVDEGSLIAIEPVSAMPIKERIDLSITIAPGYKWLEPGKTDHYKAMLRIEEV
jgi:galactose mutarotase-like enzyme